MQDGHLPQGVSVGPSAQFRHLAKILAEVVLPQPLGPENKYAWLTRSARSAAISGSTTWV
jgi:hypothetical protein